MSDDGWVRVGVITRPHGVRGALRLFLDNPDSELLSKGLAVQLRQLRPPATKPAAKPTADRPAAKGGGPAAAPVRRELRATGGTIAKVFGTGDRIELEGVTTREAAEDLRGAELCVHRDAFPEPDDDESYLVDMIGVEVHDTDGVRLGTIEAFSDNGAQPLAQVMVGTKRGRKRYVEMPFVPELIDHYDDQADVLVVDPPGGLFDGDAEVAGDANKASAETALGHEGEDA